MKFTYQAYERLLRLLVINSYEITNYHNAYSIGLPCILRHDIDLCPEAAVKIGALEESLGVKSTYFVLLNTSFYNVAFRETKGIIKQLQKQGHEIGLHFDEMQYKECENDVVFKEHVYREADILSKIIDAPVTTVSMHRPSKRTLESNYSFEGMVNSYSRTFVNNFKYLSDSRMHWRENAEAVITSKKYCALHILTHPFWYKESEASIHDVLLDFIIRANTERYSMLNNNFRDLGSVVTPDEIGD